MRKVYEGQAFAHWFDRDSGRVFSDLEFRRCTFWSCGVGYTCEPRLRSTARNVVLYKCEVNMGGPGTSALEDIVVDGLEIVDRLITRAAVFRHVTLKGRIGCLILDNLPLPWEKGGQVVTAFREANAAYYQGVDWALDISQAEFKAEPGIYGIPGRLIRRDPETQVMITRERALSGMHRELPFPDSLRWWPGWIDNHFAEQGHEDLVLVAPKRSRQFKDLLAGLELLRKAGVAEPD